MVPNQVKPRHKGMPKQKWGIAHKKYLALNSPDCDRQLLKVISD